MYRGHGGRGHCAAYEGWVVSAAHLHIVTGGLQTRGDTQNTRVPAVRLNAPPSVPRATKPCSPAHMCQKKWHPQHFTSVLGSDSSLITSAQHTDRRPLPSSQIEVLPGINGESFREITDSSGANLGTEVLFSVCPSRHNPSEQLSGGGVGLTQTTPCTHHSSLTAWEGQPLWRKPSSFWRFQTCL